MPTPADGTGPSPVRAQSLVAQVHADVRAGIASGRHPAGEALNIAETAKRLGVSPTPVREAFARLAAEGFLRFHENLGYRVPALPTAKDYVDWAVARVAVESSALRFVMGPLDPRLIDEAEAINDDIRRARFGKGVDGVRRFSEQNWAFHSRLIALARNATLSELHARLYAAPQFARIFVGRGIPAQARVVAEHAQILAHLRAGACARAASALQDHILASLERDARLADITVSLRRLADQGPAATRTTRKTTEER